MKNFAIFIVCLSLTFFGCTSSPKSINFNELSSKVFTLEYVIYMTNMNEYNQDIPNLFLSLPIQAVVEQAELKYGINIDTSLFEDNEKNVSQIKSYNLSMPNYFVEYKTENAQRVTIDFGKFHQEKDLRAVISLGIYEDNKKIFGNEYLFHLPEWSPYQ